MGKVWGSPPNVEAQSFPTTNPSVHKQRIRGLHGEAWIGSQRSAVGKGDKKGEALYPNSGIEKPKRGKVLHLYKGSTKGTRMLQAYSGDSAPFEFPRRNAITKLAQVHGLSKKEESLKSSTLLSPSS